MLIPAAMMDMDRIQTTSALTALLLSLSFRLAPLRGSSMYSRMGLRVVTALSAAALLFLFAAQPVLAQCRGGARPGRSLQSAGLSSVGQQRLSSRQQQQLNTLMQQQLLALQQRRLAALVALAQQQQLTAIQQQQLAALAAIVQQQNAAGPQLRAVQLIGR